MNSMAPDTISFERKATGPRVVCLVHSHTRYQVVGLAKFSPIFQSRPEAEKWMRTEVAKLPSSQRPRERACLCCSKTFVSQGAHNRMCDPCRLSAAGTDTGSHRFISPGRRG